MNVFCQCHSNEFRPKIVLSPSKFSFMENPGSETMEQPALKKDIEKEEKFFPSGAIVFFILLVMLCLAFWYGIYFLMIQRA